jgi:hypothetical protein
MTKSTVYLCGPIRGREDYKWRLQFIRRYEGAFRCLVPSDIGVEDFMKLRQFKPSAYMTYRTDLHLIDLSDIIVANLLPLDEGYPGRGSLIEIGYGIALKKLMLVVGSEELRKHPFLHFGPDGMFGSLEELYGYIDQYVQVLSGDPPQIRELIKNLEIPPQKKED